MKTIYLAGGCFWGLQQYLSLIEGVVSTEAGYANGKTLRPSYEEVCRAGTDHAETVKLSYDPLRLSLTVLLDAFYRAIDPTAVNRQGGDTGRQYRTGIYYTDDADRPVIEESLRNLQAALGAPVAIEAMPLENYWPAEEEHQNYLEKHPGGYCHIGPAQMAWAKQAGGAEGPEALRKRLTPLQYEVTQQAATEPPFQNEYNAEFRPGVYVDVVSGDALFLSAHKFESGCGWPAFSRPIRAEELQERPDGSHGMQRTEVRAARSGAHLGHVFPDGPPEAGGLRYCINSAALRFIPKERMAAEGYADLLPLLENE